MEKGLGDSADSDGVALALGAGDALGAAVLGAVDGAGDTLGAGDSDGIVLALGAAVLGTIDGVCEIGGTSGIGVGSKVGLVFGETVKALPFIPENASVPMTRTVPGTVMLREEQP